MNQTINKLPSPASPPVHERYKRANPLSKKGHAQLPRWPVSGLTEPLSPPSQARVQNAQWLMMKAECVVLALE
jgi:hypothetical protein